MPGGRAAILEVIFSMVCGCGGCGIVQKVGFIRLDSG